LRIVYVLLTYLVVPLVIAMEGWKALWNPEYRGRLNQRLGFVERQARPGAVWVHAVSVGEVQASAALIRELQVRYPGTEFVVTTVTPTGAQRARALFKDSVHYAYLPYDLPGAVGRFLDRIQPRVAIILETEIWPTLYHTLGRRRIPLVLASARLSVKSVDRYRRLSSLFADTLSHGILIGAQTAADAGRFRAIGAAPDRVRVTGNIKYDLQIPEASIEGGRAFRDQCGVSRPVWIAGSTHEGEEEAALEAHAKLRERHPGALLILVPRHPQRFETVRALLRKRGVAFAQRSAGQVPRGADTVLLVDTLGELQLFYAAADIAFVGGSLVPVGGHNLLEPAVLGLPMLSGPHTQNAQDIAEVLERSGALTIVADAAALAQKLIEDCDDPARARAEGERGRAVVAQSRGAVDRLVAMVVPLLSPSASPSAPESSSAASGSR
jgi:3-deoxy-D-manno-octulosonic-acid transferase